MNELVRGWITDHIQPLESALKIDSNPLYLMILNRARLCSYSNFQILL